MKEEVFEAYQKGDYATVIDELRTTDDLSERFFLFDAYAKSNRTDELVYSGCGMMQETLFCKTQDEYMALAPRLMSHVVLQTGIRVMKEFYELKDSYESTLLPKYKEKLQSFSNDNTLVLPVIWPIAYGDMIVFNQYIKHFKKMYTNIIVMIPLNRPELKELFSLNADIDLLIDLTLLPEESDRQKSLSLMNGKYFNVTLQELEVYKMMECLEDVDYIRLRYLPYMFSVNPTLFSIPGFRIWENRAKLFLESKAELPKLVEQKEEKTNQITVHFREGKYGDSEARDINPNYSQQLIDEIKKLYPDYHIVRLGDSSMTFLQNCQNMSHENASVVEQIKAIQKSKLFIGCHSAPQMLAVACSDTPVICIKYTAQETTNDMSDNVAKLSYEPIGKQVKKIFYNKMYDKDGNKLIPTQNNPDRVVTEPPSIPEILQEVKNILGPRTIVV